MFFPSFNIESMIETNKLYLENERLKYKLSSIEAKRIQETQDLSFEIEKLKFKINKLRRKKKRD